MNDYDLPNSSTEFIILKNQNVSANIDGINVDLINYLGVVDVMFDISIPSNLTTSPKLNFVMQTATDAITYVDVPGANVNVTNTNTFTQLSVDTRSVNRYIRVRTNVAGGNAPGWCSSVMGLATLRYNPS